MSVKDCFQKLKEYYKDKKLPFNERELAKIARKLHEIRAEADTKADFIKKANKIIYETVQERIQANKTANYMTLAQMSKNLETIRVTGKMREKWGIATRLQEFSRGNAKISAKGMNVSVADMRAALTKKYLAGIHAILQEKIDVAESGLYAREITHELFNIQRGGTSPVSGSADAFAIAKAYAAAMSEMVRDAQAVNPFFTPLMNYMFRATHDPKKMQGIVKGDLAASKLQWMEDVHRWFGKNSFPELEGKEKIAVIGNIFHNIVRGEYGAFSNQSSGDILKKMSADRVLIPNDAESFYQYNQKYGETNPHTTVLSMAENMAHDIAVMSKWGPLPQKGFDLLIEQLKKTSDQKDLELLATHKQSIENAFDSSVRRSVSPAIGKYAGFVNHTMFLTQMAKNWGSYLRQVPDLANFTSVLTDMTGQSFVSNFMEATQQYVKAMASLDQAGKTKALEDMYLFVRSALHNINNEYGTDPTVKTELSLEDRLGKTKVWLLTLQSKATLAQRHMTAIESAFAGIVSRRLGELTLTPFDKLPEATQKVFQRYKISPYMWEVLKNGTTDMSHLDGDTQVGELDRFLTAKSVRNIPDSEIEKWQRKEGVHSGDTPMTKKQLDKARLDIDLALGGMLNQAADMVSSSAGPAERGPIFMNRDLDSATGAMTHLIMQFGTAIIKNYDTMMRVYHNQGGGKLGLRLGLNGSAGNLVRHVILGAALTTVMLTLKQLLTNEAPEDPLNPKIIAQSVVDTGVFGLLGDRILSPIISHPEGYGVAESMGEGALGPAIGTAIKAAEAMLKVTAYKTGLSHKYPGGAVSSLINSNFPGHNLPYGIAAYNYLLGNQIRAWQDPAADSKSRLRLLDKKGLFTDHPEYFGLGGKNVWR